MGTKKVLPLSTRPKLSRFPVWYSNASERVVFPASTLAIIPVTICFNELIGNKKNAVLPSNLRVVNKIIVENWKK